MKSSLETIYLDQLDAQQAVTWSDRIQSWIAVDQEIGTLILRSGKFMVDDPTHHLQQIAAENGISIPRILAAVRDAPSALNDKAHKNARRQFATQLASRFVAVAELFGSECRERLAELLTPGQSVDLFSQLLFPAINSAIVPLGGRDISAELFSIVSPSQVISSVQMFSGARLSRLEATVSAAPAVGASSCDHVMPLFARDPTLGSLSLSLIDVLKEGRGLRLCDIDWPLSFTRSSLPFVVRFASSDMEIAGKHIKKGDRMTVYLGAFAEGGDLIFGAGQHRCVGEALAKSIWHSFRLAISARRERLEIEHVEYRAADAVFIMPVKIQAKVTV